MLTRLDAFRPHALLLTLPVTLLWTPQLGVALGAVVVLAHAAGVLFLSATWTRRDLAASLDPRLGLSRDRFSVDREALDLAASMIGIFCAAMVVVLLVAAFPVGVYAVFALASGWWVSTLPRAKRYVRLEVIAPAALLIGPAMLLRAPAWRGHESDAITAAAHATAWFVGALLLVQMLVAMTRDREADAAAGVSTTASALTREGSVVLIALIYATITLLAALGAWSGWWGVAPVLLAGWTSTAVVALLCVRWDSWAVGLGAVGGGMAAFSAAFAAI